MLVFIKSTLVTKQITNQIFLFDIQKFLWLIFHNSLVPSYHNITVHNIVNWVPYMINLLNNMVNLFGTPFYVYYSFLR